MVALLGSLRAGRDPRSQAPIERSEYETSDKWHTDVGDTPWADTQAAYDGLSQPIKDLVDPPVAGTFRRLASSDGRARDNR
jgi:hypothetical protein